MAAIALLLGEALPMTCGLLIAVIVVWPHPRVRHHRIRNRIFLWRVRRTQRRSRTPGGSVHTPDVFAPQASSGDRVGVERATVIACAPPASNPVDAGTARTRPASTGCPVSAGTGGQPPTASRVRRATTPVGGVTPASASPTGLQPRRLVHG